MRKDNRGFSFVELLVVMAIMIIGITTAYNIYGYLDNANSKKLIANIQSVMNSTRTESMTYGGDIKCTLSISERDGKTYIRMWRQAYDTDAHTGEITWKYDGHGNVLYESEPYVDTVLGNEIVEAVLAIEKADGTFVESKMNYQSSTNMAGLEFHYKRSTGGFSKMSCNGVVDDPMIVVSGSSYAVLTIKTSTGQSSSLKLYFVTGRIEQI